MWFIDLQNADIFPYPPSRDNVFHKWLKKVILGEEVHLTWQGTNDRPVNNNRGSFITYTLITINLLVFLFMTLAGGSTNTDVLIAFGAKWDPLIQQGQVWRLLASSFIHIGIVHLAFNMYSLWVIGPVAEKLFGHIRYLIIYILSALGGSLASFFFSPTTISAGASGAIFGVLGALLLYSWQNKHLWRSGLGKNLLVIVGINLFFGLTQQGIDNFDHIGGLLTGIIVAYLVTKVNLKQNA